MTDKVLIDCHDDALALARRGLFGGRVECGYIGEYHGEFYQLDVNSSYAASMCDLKVPRKLVWHTFYASHSDLHEWCTSGVCVADVTIYTTNAAFPYRSTEGVLFANGSFRTVLCGDELKFSLAYATIVKVHEASCYEYSYAFRAYIESMWNMRRENKISGNDDESDKYKLLMNSFFGKWAQTGSYWEKIADANDMSTKTWAEVDYDTKEVRELRQFAGIVQEKGKESESVESSPAIAACVTASARMRLWNFMQEAGIENIYYVDTDSLLVNNVGYRRLLKRIDPCALGALKLVGTYDRIKIRGCKDYELGDRKIHSGVSASGVYTDSGGVVQTHRIGLAQEVRREDDSATRTRRVSKEFGSVYRKGVVGKDGKVTPVYL